LIAEGEDDDNDPNEDESESEDSDEAVKPKKTPGKKLFRVHSWYAKLQLVFNIF
jgi:hypothetical protein